MKDARRYTARVIVAPRDARGRRYLVVIEDTEKSTRLRGTCLAFPGGGSHEGEFPFQTALRELEEETGLRPDKAFSQPRELGSIPLNVPNRPPHKVCLFEVVFPFEYVMETLRAVAEGRLQKKERRIRASLLPTPIDSREFLGSQCTQLRTVAPTLHSEFFV